IQEAERGLAAYRETLGDEHPQTVHAMLVVGFVRQFLGEYEQARPLLEKSLSVQLKLSRDLLPTLSEAEALAYVGRTDSARDPLLAVLRQTGANAPADAYQVVWDLRALATQALLARRQAVAQAPAARPLWEELRATRARLAQVTLAEVAPQEAAARRKEL